MPLYSGCKVYIPAPIIARCPAATKMAPYGDPLVYGLRMSLFVCQSLPCDGGLHIPETHLLVGFGRIL